MIPYPPKEHASEKAHRRVLSDAIRWVLQWFNGLEDSTNNQALVSDGAGSLSFKEVINTEGGQTVADDLSIGGASGGALVITDTNAGTDAGAFGFVNTANGANLIIGPRTDVGNITSAITVNRTGSTANSVTINTVTFQHFGNAVLSENEGTYNPTITPASGTITLLAGGDTLAYSKIGKRVCVSGTLTVTSVSSPSGVTKISLPFAVASDTDTENASGVLVWAQNLISFTDTNLALLTNSGASDATFAGANPTASSPTTNLGASFRTNVVLRLCFSYTTT